VSTVCDVHGPYHFFSIPTGERGFGRECACGVPQVYRPPTGSESAKFSDVLVDAEDLRDLVQSYLDQRAMPDAGGDELCERLMLLLD
jgi:hypothetical protein